MWTQTNDVEMLLNVMEKTRKGLSVYSTLRSADLAAYAIRAVHDTRCKGSGGVHTQDGSCELWKKVWRELRFRASEGELRTLGLTGNDSAPERISPSVWTLAKLPDEPTCLELPSDIVWKEVRFDARDVLKSFTPKADERPIISVAELREWIREQIKEPLTQEELVKRSRTACPKHRPRSRETVRTLAKELGFSPRPGPRTSA